ncbi:MAG: flagellar P-ring protein [Alphaproteobacteria bacterium]|nr:MAG: flagellar P-ring protein [Alphaproteobacteria bacterium]
MAARLATFVVLVLVLALQPAAAAVRIKDIVSIQGVRDNQLVGYGLVVGLKSTGDSLRNAPFTESSMRAMLDRMGVGAGESSIRTRNVAAVLVTAKLPAFIDAGGAIDVTVSSIGDAESLQGGTLVATPLYGADGNIYAVAQGSLVVSGFSAAGEAAEITSSTPTSARIPNGALVEHAAPGNLEDEDQLVLELTNPDFNTVIEVTDRINAYTMTHYGKRLATERDNRSIVVRRPQGVTNTRFFAAIGAIEVNPDAPARIVVDERTGTVVIGSDVRISTVAITHGNLTVSVVEDPRVVQPEPFSKGETAVEPNTFVDAQETGGALGIVEGPSLRDLVNGLNSLGAKPSGIIAILQAIKSAGAIHATLVVQ